MKKQLIAFFKKNPGRQFKSRDVAKKLGLTEDHEYAAVKAMLFQLFKEEVLTRTGKKYELNRMPDVTSNTAQGELQINQGGYGFVLMKDKNMGDVFIAARNLGTGFHGDVVEVSLFANQKGRNMEGQVVRVVRRKRQEIVGILNKTKSFYFIKPDDSDIHRDIYIDKENLNGAKKGDKVIVNDIVWDSPMLNPEGKVSEVIGKPGTPDTDLVSIAHEFGLPFKFSERTMAEAQEVPLEIDPEEIAGRLDFRDKNVVTIDPADAKDFDDALSIEQLDNGNLRVGIHIADVSHYVQPGTSLDNEALDRGNSVYLVGRVIPMLPEQLSNRICSLVPYEDRLTYSVVAEITKRGKLENYDIRKSVINSKRRFTYEEAQDVIETGKGDFADDILKLHTLAQTLRKKRMREGSIEFSTPEIKFELDENGRPVAVTKKVMKESNQLVEEFMLLANKICAKHVALPEGRNGKDGSYVRLDGGEVKTAAETGGKAKKGRRGSSDSVKPFIYRIHDKPDPEKVFEFAKFVKTLGYNFDPNASSRSNQFQLLILQAKDTEEETLINELAIRSMAKAVYSPENIGHYGLGFRYYTHFTSPIRRYSDLMVHRLLHQYLDNRNGTKYSYDTLDEISEHISGTERVAVEAERYSVKMKQIEYLQEHLGSEFKAIISGITHFGMFVKITDILAEGLIRLKDLEGDFYVYDEKKYSLIGRRTKKQYRLGDKVDVKLVRVDPDKSELDFIIVED